MIFHAHAGDLDFELAGKRYVVPAGSDVEIPDHLAYCVGSRGLSLARGSGGGVKAAPVASEKHVRPQVNRDAPSKREAAEELADITGEDPSEDEEHEDEADEDDDPVSKTAAQLQRQGIVLPGRKPRKG